MLFGKYKLRTAWLMAAVLLAGSCPCGVLAGETDRRAVAEVISQKELAEEEADAVAVVMNDFGASGDDFYDWDSDDPILDDDENVDDDAGGEISADGEDAGEYDEDDGYATDFSAFRDEEWDKEYGAGDSEYTVLYAMEDDPLFQKYEDMDIDGLGLRYVMGIYMRAQQAADEEEWEDDLITVKGSKHAKEFIEYIGPMCMGDAAVSGILASVTIAQAILESGYGRSGLAKKANNLFGIKAGASRTTWSDYSVWDGSYYQTKTKEQLPSGAYVTITARFRAYPNIQASIADHSAYLAHARKGKYLRYGGLVGCTDYRKCFQIIRAGGYATSHDYVDKLCKIVEMYDLTKFD